MERSAGELHVTIHYNTVDIFKLSLAEDFVADILDQPIDGGIQSPRWDRILRGKRYP
jgi:hypothetical protein